jgi:hypothetical protein
LVKFLNEIKKTGQVNPEGLTENAQRYITEYFAEEVTNQHQITEASKNVAMNTLFKISSAPVNAMASSRGVDMNDP